MSEDSWQRLARGSDSEAAESSGLWQRLELQLQTEGQARGLWPRLEGRLSTTQSRPHLRDGLVLTPAAQGDGRVFLLSDPLRGRHFRLAEREAFILSLLDGEHEIEEVAKECTTHYGPISVPAVRQFVQDLQLAGLLEQGRTLWGYLGLAGRGRPALLWTLPDAEKRLQSLYRRLRFLLHAWMWGLLVLLLVGAVALLILRRELFRADLSYISSPWRLLPFLLTAFYPLMLLVVLTHEFAHALTCVHFDGRVSRLGLMVRHLLPAAFADVSSVWSLSAARRAAVFLAGPASTVLWAAPATALWAWTRPGSFVHLLGAAVMLASFLSMWVGLNPLAGYDGSELLSEWLQVPDLHRRALDFLGKKLRGRPTAPLSRREQRVFGAYSLAVLLYNTAVAALVVWGLWSLLSP